MSRKIFIGLNNLGGLLTEMKYVFGKLNVETLTATFGDPGPIIYGGGVDYDFSQYKKRMYTPVRPLWLREWLREKDHIEKKVWRKALKECDVFIYIWRRAFKEGYADYSELKKSGKKIINIFCGDDVRWYHSQKQEFESYGMRSITYENDYDYSQEGLYKKLLLLRNAEKHSDLIFSRLDQAQLELRPYYRWNMMVVTDNLKHYPNQREKNPIIAHAPTARKVKGTEYVLAAFEKLKNDGIEFTPLLIEKIPNNKALELLGNTDILIDQLIIPGTGRLATEGLALGKVVMAHMAYDKYPQKNPSECPIIDVNPDTLYNKLKELILNYDKRKAMALRGREYVFNYLDMNIFCQRIIDLLDGKKIDYDYYPSFFRENFIPESKDAAQMYNEWTATVKDCDWYKKHIPSGERSGLIF